MGQEFGENGYLYVDGWVPSLFTWKYYNLVIGYTPVQIKKLKKNCDFDSAILYLIIIMDGLTHKEL